MHVYKYTLENRYTHRCTHASRIHTCICGFVQPNQDPEGNHTNVEYL